MGFNRGNFFSALTGIIVGAVLISALPAAGGNGDDLVMGQVNYATDKTIQKTKNPFVFQTTKPGRPAAIFNVNSGPPIRVNSDVLVESLNADLLDGMEATAFAADGHDHDTDYLGIGAAAADSDLLDGMDSTDFVTVGQGCPLGTVMRGLGADGGVVCTVPPMTMVLLDSPGPGGMHTSLALDASEYPVISHYDQTSDDLMLTHCGDIECVTFTVNRVDETGDVGMYSSLVLDALGYPVISYYDGGTNLDLKVAHCSDANCTAATINTVDGADNVGEYTSLALDAAGYPVISYYDATNLDLKVAHCTDANCAGAIINAVDGADQVGRFTSLELDASGYPVIAYQDIDDSNLKVAHCSDANCAGAIINTVDNGDVVGGDASLALDASGYPVISYADYNGGDHDLRVAHCSDANCAAVTINAVDVVGQSGYSTSLVLDANGFPIISYYDLFNQDLKVAYCSDANCAAAEARTIDAAGDVGLYTSLVLNASGYPVISYRDTSPNGELKVVFL